MSDTNLPADQATNRSVSNALKVAVPLRTEDGNPVTTAIIPKFRRFPSVLIWGDRVFQRYPANSGHGFEYFECFAVAVTETIT